MKRQTRARESDPRSVPWPVEGEVDVVAVDTTWGEMQPLVAAEGVPTVGELELVELVEQGAVVVDCRTSGSFGGRTIPGRSTSRTPRCWSDAVSSTARGCRSCSATARSARSRNPAASRRRPPGAGAGVLPRRHA